MRISIFASTHPPCDSYDEGSLQSLSGSIADGAAIDSRVNPIDSSTTLEVIENLLAEADAAIVELSAATPQLAYLLGLCQASAIPLAAIRSQRSKALGNGMHPPSTARLIEYVNLDEALPSLKDWSTDALATVADSRRALALLDSAWFGKSPGEIQIVCPPSFDDLPSASTQDANHIMLDNFGDKDSYVEVAVFLASNYGNRATLVSSERFEIRSGFRGNLVVIGGPGAEGHGGNRLTRALMDRLQGQVSYDLDTEELLSSGDTYHAEYSADGRLTTDYGYFGRFLNPFSPSHTCVLIHGIHTLGVLGSVLAFTDPGVASSNQTELRRRLESDLGFFEAVFPVSVFDGQVLVPSFDERTSMWTRAVR